MRYWILVIGLALALASCHSSRQTIVDTPTNIGAVGGIATDMTPKGQYQALAASYNDWTDVYLPINLSLIAPTRASISGRATMVRDSQIHMSLRMLGFEVAVLYIDQDSVFALEKVHKYYLAESIGDLLRGANLTIGDMQALLMGQVFEPGKGVITSNDKGLSISIDGNDLMISPKKTPHNTEWLYACATGAVPTLQSLDIDVPDRASVDCMYSAHALTQGGQMAKVVDINATAADHDISAQLRWDLGAAKWNEKREIKFKKPTGYKRISAATLLKSLSGL